MKNLIYMSVLTIFAMPMAFAAEEEVDSSLTSGGSYIAQEEATSSLTSDDSYIAQEEADMVAARDRCAPKKCTPPKPKCPPKAKPKCPPKKKPVYCEDKCNPTKWSFQARGAAFLPLQSEIRKIYGSALPTVELETSYPLAQWSECNQLLLFLNAGWTFQTGKTIGFGYYTRLNMVPLSLGIEYQWNLCRNLDFYIGAAPTYSFLWIEDKDGFSKKRIHSAQFGATSKTGFRFTFNTNFFLDVFGDFFYTPFGRMHDSIQSFNGNITGFFVGAGLGGKW